MPGSAALCWWTRLVGPGNALPDYPRPQMVRADWLTLNGVWGYLGRSSGPVRPAPPPPAAYREQILVPYLVESSLSGIARHDDEMWYRKVFKLPAAWLGRNVLVHFGAVDQVATVWVNNQRVAHHEGGYTEFSADITKALRWLGPQVITVRVEDRNEASPFPVGKQRNHPAGLFYTGASGIWQTVWLEPVRATHIDKLDITSDLASLTVTPRLSGSTDQRVVVVAVEPGGRVVATASGRAGDPVRLPIPKPHPWTPDDPHLYDLTAAVVSPSGKVVDADMPSLNVSLVKPVGPAPEPSPAAKANFERELFAMVDQLRSVTSIVGWVPFNEGWGEYDAARIAAAVKAADPTRMVDANSGVNCCKSRGDTGAGDIYDDHTYVGPGRPARRDHRVRVDGEYGGLGLVLEKNRWPGRSQAYEMTRSPERLTARYVDLSRALEAAVRRDGLSGAIYTQTTDVENEVNGFLSYDRWVVKMTIPVVAERNRTVIAAGTPGAAAPPDVRR